MAQSFRPIRIDFDGICVLVLRNMRSVSFR